MDFNKDIFLNYMKNSMEEGIDISYMYRLYRTYNAINTIINSDMNKNENKLKQYEDLIYTVEDEVLDDKKRINLALESIFLLLDQSTIKEDIYDEIMNLKQTVIELDLDKEENVKYAKKQISIIQAKLNMENTFFIATYEAFLELYRNIYIKSINDESKNKKRN